ncbi:MAG: hypothetical protein ABI843_04815 [Dokdonella sp.]
MTTFALRASMCSLLACAALACATAHADDGDSADSGAKFKLTPAWYDNSDGNDAWDVNLRADLGEQKVWLGQYQDQQNFRQTRAGYEYDPDFGWVGLSLSAQAASRGFLGGSAQANIGGDNYAIVGFGRTNLRPYYNLNFDPNDAITLGLGSKSLLPHSEISLFQVRDDRLHTQQRITHALLKYHLSELSRLTVDATYKHGLADDDVMVHGYGLALEYDYRQVFCKLARERAVNFTHVGQTRVALGLRF